MTLIVDSAPAARKPKPAQGHGATLVGPRGGPVDLRARSVLSPRRSGRARASASPAVTKGSDEPPVITHSAHAAEIMRAGNSDCGPQGLGSVVGQQMGSNRSS